MELLSNKLTWPRFARDVCVFFLIYVSAIVFVPKQFFMEAINSMLAVLALVVTVVYAMGLWPLVKNGNIGIAMIRAGIVITWGMGFMTSTVRTYSIAAHVPRAGIFDWAYGLPVIVAIIAAAMHLIAIGMVENRYVRRNVCLVLWSLLSGLVIAGGIRAAEHWALL